jgi:hypothetical protein
LICYGKHSKPLAKLCYDNGNGRCRTSLIPSVFPNWYSVRGTAGRGFLQYGLVSFPLEVVTRGLLWGRHCLERWRLPWLQRPPSLLNRCQKSWRCIRFTHHLRMGTRVNNKNQKLDQDYYICISYYYFIVKNVEELVWSKITVDSCKPALFSWTTDA